jgi:hypothetical protein
MLLDVRTWISRPAKDQNCIPNTANIHFGLVQPKRPPATPTSCDAKELVTEVRAKAAAAHAAVHAL